MCDIEIGLCEFSWVTSEVRDLDDLEEGFWIVDLIGKLRDACVDLDPCDECKSRTGAESTGTSGSSSDHCASVRSLYR